MQARLTVVCQLTPQHAIGATGRPCQLLGAIHPSRAAQRYVPVVTLTRTEARRQNRCSHCKVRPLAHYDTCAFCFWFEEHHGYPPPDDLLAEKTEQERIAREAAEDRLELVIAELRAPVVESLKCIEPECDERGHEDYGGRCKRHADLAFYRAVALRTDPTSRVIATRLRRGAVL